MEHTFCVENLCRNSIYLKLDITVILLENFVDKCLFMLENVKIFKGKRKGYPNFEV